MTATDAARCAQCGGLLPERAVFCPSCGVLVTNESPPGIEVRGQAGYGAEENGMPSVAPIPGGSPLATAPEFVPSSIAVPASGAGQPFIGSAAFSGPGGGAAESDVAPVAQSGPSRATRAIVAAGLALVILVAGVVGSWWWTGKPDRDYLAGLKAGGLSDQFASDAEAIAHAKMICAGLEGGQKQQGMPADLEAVKAYCSQFTDGFKVLATKQVDGTFTLIETSYYGSGISSSGGTCSGSGGYSDIHSGTEVVLKNGDGKLLASATLGMGLGTSSLCTFAFGFDVTEGEDSYILSVSHRGEMHYTWESLTTAGGVALSMGD